MNLPLEFVIWYSGMEEKKILRAHKKWLKETTKETPPEVQLHRPACSDCRSPVINIFDDKNNSHNYFCTNCNKIVTNHYIYPLTERQQ